jgi:hypothetical protein
MLGFVIAIATEALSGKGILGQLGLGDGLLIPALLVTALAGRSVSA